MLLVNNYEKKWIICSRIFFSSFVGKQQSLKPESCGRSWKFGFSTKGAGEEVWKEEEGKKRKLFH